MTSNEADESYKKDFLIHLKNRSQNNLQSREVVSFVFDYVQLLYYKCHKINLNCGGSYIDSLDWIKNKKKQQ